MSKSTFFSNETIKNLQYYVYVYSDPDTCIPFYIGKGKGNRAFAHLSQEGESEKIAKLQELKAEGKEPLIEILIHGVNEETALKVEAAAIDLIGIENLTNEQRGHHSSLYGKIDVDMINARYNCEELSVEDIVHNVIMIRINKLYHNGMSAYELYDVTRGCWKVSFEKASKVEYAFSVYDGMVMEVYKIACWLPACQTMSTPARPEVYESVKDRFEFVGNLAEDEVRNKYIGKMVSNLFCQGNQNPIHYIIHE